ncbi:hypothetical protein Q7P37_007954 [Cladosporium fusiforme]
MEIGVLGLTCEMCNCNCEARDFSSGFWKHWPMQPIVAHEGLDTTLGGWVKEMVEIRRSTSIRALEAGALSFDEAARGGAHANIWESPHDPSGRDAMDFWSRLIGGSYAPKKTPAQHIHDPRARLARFKKAYHAVTQLCNRPRNLARDATTLDDLKKLFDRLSQLIREETRAPAPHLCLQYAASNQIYVTVTRAAIVSHHEGVVHATINLLATLVDSEEEDFLSSQPFAKSLMRLITRVVDTGHILLELDTETAILELLFTVAAKIRLQPGILPVWFASSSKPDLDYTKVREKKGFVGVSQKDDFPLCYLLIDRVHHDGRIGDFARTGLLYIFEATGRSTDLEEWVVSSDLPTLMASGLGALYSQLSRELSILHPDATLPAVLAMSDYSTTHARATAESAFSDRHKSHMATFLSYLAFWQDVLDHCRSADVKQTLLDHFQILFLQQLLYPSILQSSDTDAGSSVAVLTYVTTILAALDYPDLIHNILAYLLAIRDAPTPADMEVKAERRSSEPPRSPTTTKRRQSLMLLAATKDPEDAVEPTLFNLVDLISNSLRSNNGSTVYAALNLASTVINRHKKYAFGTLLKVHKVSTHDSLRTSGAQEQGVEKYSDLALSLHDLGIDEAYVGLAEDVRLAIETQALPAQSLPGHEATAGRDTVNMYTMHREDSFMRLITALLRTFLTNSVDVNLALTQVLISIAACIEIRLDDWFVQDAAHGSGDGVSSEVQKPSWQSYMDEDDDTALSALSRATCHPNWSEDRAPIVYTVLQSLAHEVQTVRETAPNLDQLISGRKNMLQAADLEAPLPDPHSLSGSPMPTHLHPVASKPQQRGHSRGSSTSSAVRGRNKATDVSSADHSSAASPSGERPAADGEAEASSKAASQPPTPQQARSIFQPPPPETPSTTDVLMQKISFDDEEQSDGSNVRTASLNHILTNVVVLQEFVLELVAVLQVRTAVLGEREVRFAA